MRPPHFEEKLFESPKIMIFEVSGVHMGRYGLILCANESYTNNLAFGINFDLISAYNKSKNIKNQFSLFCSYIEFYIFLGNFDFYEV